MIKSLVVVIDKNFAIGKDNGLLCHLSDDLKNFKKATLGKPIIMGRKTYESRGRLLPGRDNVILSRNTDFQIDGAICLNSIDAAINWGLENKKEEIVFIGGGFIYNEVAKICDTLHITHIDHTFDGADTFFPKVDLESMNVIESLYWPADEKNEFNWKYQVYTK
jgi:dihydrofolate reductase